MDTECKMSVETLGIVGFDYRTVPPVDLEKRRHLMVEEETAAERDRQKLDEKTATISGKGENYCVAEAKDSPILIDFEKICLWDHDGDLKVGIRMEDPDYMKRRLLEWVHAVAAYIHFLHASAADIT